MRTTRILVSCLLALVAATLPAASQEREQVTVTLVRWPYT